MLETPYVSKLTGRQTARLSLGIALIYWPIRIYLNLFPLTPTVVADKLPFFIVELVLTFGFVWGWVRLVDWLSGRFMSRFTRPTTGAIRLPAQALALLVAGLLALLFNDVFGRVHRQMERDWDDEFTLQEHREVGQPGDMDENGQRRRMNNGLMVLTLLAAYYLTANKRSGQQMQALLIKAEQLQKEAAQAQFAALRNQVNPHFLFNSLSILSSLVEVDAQLSIEFINRLSKAYRYILEQRDAERVPLQTELDFIDSYAFLLSIRFDERLQVRIDVPAADRDRYQIAPLTLQLLVENAVKHNQMSDEAPLVVHIERTGDYLRIANPLQPRPHPEASTGVGLTNIINRYQLLTDQPVWAGEMEDEFVVNIPLLA